MSLLFLVALLVQVEILSRQIGQVKLVSWTFCLKHGIQSSCLQGIVTGSINMHIHIGHVQSATDTLKEKLPTPVAGSGRRFEHDAILFSEYWSSAHSSAHCNNACWEINIMAQISKVSKSPFPLKTNYV